MSPDEPGPFLHVPCPLCCSHKGLPCLTVNGPPDFHDERRQLAAQLRSSDGARRLAGRELAERIARVYLGPSMKLSDDAYFRVQPDLFSTSPEPAPEAPTPPPPVDREAEAVKRLDRAMAAARRPQLDGWREAATAFVRRYLETHETLFADDLWDQGLPECPGDKRAFGDIIRKAALNRWMEDSGTARPSNSSNRSRKPVWRSLLYLRPAA